MLENYLKTGTIATSPERQRIIALNAALELAKAALGSSSANSHSSRVGDSLEGVTKNIADLADAIQEAAKVK